MTFLKIIRYIQHIFFISYLLSIPSLEAQTPVFVKLSGDFPLNNLFSPETKIFCQAYNASLDILAISVKNRIILWNGYSTSEIICKGNAFIDISKSGRLFFATNNQLGYVENINQEKVDIHVLTQILPIKDSIDISGLVCMNEIVFIHSGNRIIKYDGKELSTVLTSATAFKLIKSGNDHLYISRLPWGLQSIYSTDSINDLKFTQFFRGIDIELLLESGQDMYVVTSLLDIYYCNNISGPIKICHLPDDFKCPFTGGWIDNNRIILGNSMHGIVIIDTKSKEQFYFSKKNGLLDNSVQGIFVNPAGYLYLIHPDGISRILDPSRFSIIEYSPIIDARIVKMFDLKSGLFLASTNGLFQIIRNHKVLPDGYYSNEEYITKISGYDSEIISSFNAGNEHYFVSKNGILLLRNNVLTMVQTENSIHCAYQREKDSTMLILGLNSGWKVLKLVNHSFTILSDISNYPYSIEAISETSNGSIILKTGNNELIELLPEIISKTKKRDPYSILKSPVLNSSSRILFDGEHFILSTSDSIFILDENRQEFIYRDYPATILNECLEYEYISHDNKGNVWFTGKSTLNHSLLGIFQFRITDKKLILINWNGVVDSKSGSINDLVLTSEGNILYATNQNLVQLKNSDTNERKLRLTIEFAGKTDKVNLNNGSLIYQRISRSHYHNSFNIKYFCDYPESEKSVIYRYKLEGKEHVLSKWNISNEANFNDLTSGNYLLTIEAFSLAGSGYGKLEIPLHINMPIYLKWYMILIYLLVAFAIIIIYVRWKSFIFLKNKIKLESIVSQRTEELQNEKEKSEILLANILPKDTADELKNKGKASTQKYEMVTVLFSDIQGFTKIAEQMNPEALIDQLDNFYFHFDSVVEKYNIEKIKTIGDAYMCAGGIPEKNRTNPVEVVLAALEVQDFMRQLKKKNSDIWDVRIGIHTGPVIAGVIGHKKFSYDIWGDTVNTASRMESSGEASKINISGHTYELVKDFFICEYRGKMPVKYKGEIDMYFVKGIRPELSVDLYRIPNKNFFIHLQKLRLVDVEEFIFQTFEAKDTSKLYFHNYRHTMEVYSLVELLGRAEGVSEEELLLARTAALVVDAGFLIDYTNSTSKSIEFAQLNLPKFRYTESQIQQVIQLLQKKDKADMSSPLAEKIISDAGTIYFGRVDFLDLAESLFKELTEKQLVSSKREFVAEMTKVLHEHQYYTGSAKRLQEIGYTEQIEQLKKLA